MLKQLVLRKRISGLQSKLSELRKKEDEFSTRKEEMKTREAELETAINELTEESTEEDRTAVDEAVAAFEADQEALSTEQKDNDEAKGKLEGEIQTLQDELDELDKRSKTPPAAPPRKNEREKEIGGEIRMKRQGFFSELPYEQRTAFVAREDVKGFLARIREFKGQQRAVTGAELAIPEVMLDMLRENMYRYSKLITKVRVKTVGGKARQNIAGAIPEGVWTEAVGALNELALKFNQVEVDGYKVGGFIPVPNSTLEDSDINLAAEIMDALGQAIGLAIDKAILYGTGTKMPLGIATRLAQTSEPSDWGTDAPDWTDLHTSNVLKINPSGMTSEQFFAALVLALGVAKPDYAVGGTFWAMNRKTKMTLMSKAITFNAAGALVAGLNGTMPIESGDIVELPFIPDNDIIGGFGSLYLLAERSGSQFAVSEHVKFVEDQTVFRGTARYDGMPVFGEGFVIVNINNATATTTDTFETDYANTELGSLAVTSVAGTASGDTKITVTGKESSGTTLGYKVAGKVAAVNSGDSNTGYTAWDGSADITAATGKIITVVEFDGAGRAIKVGSAQVVAKA